MLPKYSFVYLLKTIKINKQKLHIKELRSWFSNQDILDNQQILQFYRTMEPDVKKSTVNWRIYKLVQLGILTRTGRGKFLLEGNQIHYFPQLPLKLKTLNHKLQNRSPFLNTCLWTTAVYNELMLHQPGKAFYIVEVDKDAVESVFFFLKEQKYSVFMDPTRELLNKYVPEDKNPWIVKPLVTEAPVQKVSKVVTTTIEKMLVDILCDSEILDAQQGSEKDRIFQVASERYIIHENRMLRYADRRNRKELLIQYLNRNTIFRQKSTKSANF